MNRRRFLPFFALAALALSFGNAARASDHALSSDQARQQCLAGRRHICGRVIDIVPEGLVVESGYPQLLNPPYNQSWVVRGAASLRPSPALVEEKTPDAVAVGTVLLTNFPKRPDVKRYDYVVIRGYPTGQAAYSPVAGVHKNLRRFSASLERAIKINSEPPRAETSGGK